MESPDHNDHEYEPYLQFKSPPPPNVIVKENEHLILECDVIGTPNPIIYWLRNGQLIQQSGNIESDDRFLLINKLQQSQLGLSNVKSRLFLDCPTPESDSGDVYTCVAITAFEEIRSKTKLLVEPNDKKHNNRELELFLHENSIENHHDIESNYPNIINVFNSHSTKNNLALTKSCFEKPSLDSPPRIYFWTETIVENIGDNARLHCHSNGYPQPNTNWFVNENSEPIMKNDNKYEILPSGDLLIRNVTFDDMNVYKCFVQNEFGSDTVEQIFFYPILVCSCLIRLFFT